MARRRKKKVNRKVLIIVLIVCGVPMIAFGLLIGGKVLDKILPKDPVKCAETSSDYLVEAQEGIDAYQKIADDPAVDEDRRRATLNEALEDYRRAFGHLTDAIKHSEKDRDAHLEYRFEAVALLEEWMEQPGLTQEMRQKLHSWWRDQLKAIITVDGENVEAHAKLTDFYWAAANLQGAKDPAWWSEFLKTAEPLSRLDPGNAALFRNMAEAHTALMPSDRATHHPQAVLCYARAVAADRTDSQTYRRWADYLMSDTSTRDRDDVLRPTGEVTMEEAKAYIAEVAETYQEESAPSPQARRALTGMNPRDVYRLAIEASPQGIPLRVALAQYEYFSGNQARAEDEFRRAMAIETKTPEDLHALAGCALSMGGAADRADEALALWETARRMDPAFLPAYAGAADVYLFRDQYEPAAQLCRAGLKVIDEELTGRKIEDVEDLQDRQRYLQGIMQLNINLARALVAEMPAEAEARASRIEEIRTHLARAGAFLTKLEDGRAAQPALLRLQVADAKVRARLALLENDLFAAEKLYRLVYEASPALDQEASSALVRIYLHPRFGEENEATRILDQLTKEFPDAPRPWLWMGQIYLAQRNMEEVTRAIRQLESLDLDDEHAGALAELKARTRALEVQIRGVPGGDMPEQVSREDVPMWLSYAQRLWDDGESDQAIDVLLSLRDQFPNDESIVVALVTLYLNADQSQMALGVLDEALQANPDSERLAFLRRVVEAPEEQRHEILVAFINEHETGARRELSLARLYASRGEAGDQERYFEHMERAVEADPALDGCLDRLFSTYLRAGRLDDAARLAERSVELNLQGVEGRIHRARLLMVQEKWDEAIGLLTEALAIRGERFGEAHALLGECHLRTGRVDEADKSFRASYELDRSDVRTLVGLAQVADLRGDSDAHRRWIGEAYTHAPHVAYVRRYWLTYRQASQEPEQFVRDCRGVLRRYPDDTEVMAMLASAYEQTTPPQYDRAEEIYRTVYDRARGSELSLRYLELLTTFLQRIGETEQAEALLSQTTSEEVADQAGLILLKARLLTEARRYDDARAEIDKVLREFPDDERGYRYLGQWALTTGRDWQAGVDALNELLRRHPDDTALIEHYYEMLMRAGMFDRAIGELEARLETRPKDDATMALLAQIHYMQGRPDEAKAMCDQAIAANANQIRARVLRSDILFERGQREASLADLQEAFSLRRSEPIALLLSSRLAQIYPDGQQAKTILLEALGESRDSVPLLRRLAQLQVNTRDWHGLDSTLQRGREVQPRLATWWILEASKWRATGQPARTAAALRTAYQLEPGNVNFMLAYFDALLDIGQYDRVIETIGEVSDPGPEVAIHLRAMTGRSRVGLGNVDEGIEDLSASLAAARTIPSIELVTKHFFAALGDDKGVELLEQWMADRPEASLRIALVLKLMQQGRWSRAEAVLAGVDVSSCPPEQAVWVLRSLGEVRYKQEDYAGAKQAYQAALAKAPDNVFILNNLAYMLAENLNDAAAALPYAQKAAELMPTDPNMADTLGWIYFQNDQREPAERELRRSLQLGETPAALYHLGRVLESLGQTDEAATRYRRGYDLVRGHPQNPFHDLLQQKVP